MMHADWLISGLEKVIFASAGENVVQIIILKQAKVYFALQLR